jgi:hypothetical protein
MRKIILIISLLALTMLIISCNEEDPVSPPSGNVLLNTSFEKNGKFSAEGWSLPLSSDSSTEVPPDGGKYSLLIESSQPPEVYAEVKVPVLANYNRYTLSFWSKSSGVTNNINGKAVLTLLRNGNEVKSVSLILDNIIWESHSLTDTFAVAPGDSFLVRLSGGMSQLFSGETNFDRCKLEAAD